MTRRPNLSQGELDRIVIMREKGCRSYCSRAVRSEGDREGGMTRRPNLSQGELDRIVIMREKGYGYAVIAKEIGCSSGAVSWPCARLGVEPPKIQWSLQRAPLKPYSYRRKNGVVRAFTEDEDAILLQLREEGHRIAEICRRLNRRSNSIIGRLMSLARREARKEGPT
jgi:hypothetical protein